MNPQDQLPPIVDFLAGFMPPAQARRVVDLLSPVLLDPKANDALVALIERVMFIPITEPET